MADEMKLEVVTELLELADLMQRTALSTPPLLLEGRVLYVIERLVSLVGSADFAEVRRLAEAKAPTYDEVE